MKIRSPALLAIALLAGCSSMGYGSSSKGSATQSSPPQQGQLRDDVNAANLPAGNHHLPAATAARHDA